MPTTDSVTLLIAAASMYLALLAVLYAVAASAYPGRFMARMMKCLRVFTLAIALKLAVELLSTWGPQLRRFTEWTVREVAEVTVGALLVYLLWMAKDQFYELEQAARKFESPGQS